MSDLTEKLAAVDAEIAAADAERNAAMPTLEAAFQRQHRAREERKRLVHLIRRERHRAAEKARRMLASRLTSESPDFVFRVDAITPVVDSERRDPWRFQVSVVRPMRTGSGRVVVPATGLGETGWYACSPMRSHERVEVTLAFNVAELPKGAALRALLDRWAAMARATAHAFQAFAER